MICNNCRYDNNENASFCRSCGVKLRNTDTVQVSVPSEKPAKKANLKKYSRLCWLLLVLLFLIITDIILLPGFADTLPK